MCLSKINIFLVDNFMIDLIILIERLGNSSKFPVQFSTIKMEPPTFFTHEVGCLCMRVQPVYICMCYLFVSMVCTFLMVLKTLLMIHEISLALLMKYRSISRSSGSFDHLPRHWLLSDWSLGARSTIQSRMPPFDFNLARSLHNWALS